MLFFLFLFTIQGKYAAQLFSTLIMFLEKQISVEWFLKDHAVMML